MRWLLRLHRYLGITVGLLMAMWCLTGLVMMYVPYPALSPAMRLAHLQPLRMQGCCRIDPQALLDADQIDRARIEMLADRPMLTVAADGDSAELIDLVSGGPLARVSAEQASQVAAGYALRGYAATPRSAQPIDYDQWTVSEEFDQERPLFRFTLRDPAGTQLYVGSRTGEVVQITSARQRGWNWVGAVPHWLYFARLRHAPQAWSELVVTASLIGCFLALTGLYVGIRQWLGTSGKGSPYRALHLWHHVTGLLFGLLTLSWVLSGLLSMNPWGLLQGADPAPAQALLTGRAPSGAVLRESISALSRAALTEAVSLQAVPRHSQLFWIASDLRGRRWRLDAAGHPAPLQDAELRADVQLLGGQAMSMELLRQADAYYFAAPGEHIQLPVWRIAPRSGSGVRYYLDPISGQLIAVMDRPSQAYRWWHDGLHRLDFAAALRGRPQWDVLMWLLLTGVTFLCITGSVLAVRWLLRG
jgi:uncharacterized iron-regulated membrane protein